MRTWLLLLVVTAAVVVVVFAKEDDQSHHLTKRSRSRERTRYGYGCTNCFGRSSRWYGGRSSHGGRSHGGHSHGHHSHGGRSHGGHSRRGGRHHSRGRNSRGRSGGRSRGGRSSDSSDESVEYGYGGQPSCRCPFQFQGQQGWNHGPQFGSVGGHPTGQNNGYYRQWFRAFATHPCCGGRGGTITFLQRTQGIRGPR